MKPMCQALYQALGHKSEQVRAPAYSAVGDGEPLIGDDISVTHMSSEG